MLLTIELKLTSFSSESMVMTQWSLIGLIAIRPANCAFYLEDSLKENSKLKNTDRDKYYVLGEMIVS